MDQGAIPRSEPDEILAIEVGLATYAIHTFKEQHPEQYRLLEKTDSLDLRRFKRQYTPSPHLADPDTKPFDDWCCIEITLVHDDSDFVKDGTWLRAPLVVTGRWGTFLYVIYDRDEHGEAVQDLDLILEPSVVGGKGVP